MLRGCGVWYVGGGVEGVGVVTLGDGGRGVKSIFIFYEHCNNVMGKMVPYNRAYGR